MLAGEMYNPYDPVLVKEREEGRSKVRIYNQTFETDGNKQIKIKGIAWFNWRKLLCEL